MYICAPLGGNIKENLEQVKRYTKYALICGTAPVVPHFYALCLNDDIPKEREIGLAAGLSLLWFCDEMWIFGDTLTEGMRGEIRFCQNLNTPQRKQLKKKKSKKVLGGNAAMKKETLKKSFFVLRFCLRLYRRPLSLLSRRAMWREQLKTHGRRHRRRSRP
mgnify:CR=1 FL=1